MKTFLLIVGFIHLLYFLKVAIELNEEPFIPDLAKFAGVILSLCVPILGSAITSEFILKNWERRIQHKSTGSDEMYSTNYESSGD